MWVSSLFSLVLVLMVAALAACSKNDDSLSDAAVVNPGGAVEEAVIEVAAGTEAAEEVVEEAAEEAVEEAAEEAVEEAAEETEGSGE